MEMKSIEIIKTYFDEWISQIEYEREKFSTEIISGHLQDFERGILAVKYDDHILFRIHFYKNRSIADDGKVTLCGMFFLYAQADNYDLLDADKRYDFSLDDRLEVDYNGQKVKLSNFLSCELPLRDENKVNEIVKQIGVEANDIIFDTYRKRYIIMSDLPFSFGDESIDGNVSFYKYVPLSVFFKMMKNKTFRMNSIVSQSDTTETFYIGDLLCDDYEDDFVKSKGFLSEDHNLITSFTTLCDDAKMWRLYGGDGKGVMFGFKLDDGRQLRKIHYIREDKTEILLLRAKMRLLKDRGIRIHWHQIDSIHRFIKSYKYKDEEEWRLLYEFPGTLDYDLYGDRLVEYKDFSFDGNYLRELGLTIDYIDVGPNEPDGTNNFVIIAKMVRQVFGKDVIVNRSRLTNSFRQID